MTDYTPTRTRRSNTLRRFSLLVLLAAIVAASIGNARADDTVLYLQSANTAEGQNSIVAYRRDTDGTLTPLPGSPFLTGGTGIDNNTNGKLGPNDNDTPIVQSAV